ncbi:MAG: DUF2791 family P-loop domain-containing protein, partial [Candidatus Thermoplasmatota archaeon]|nr:DUF2791 family P-loop domain-containing protein [Candidatus Thermoplasmatota archaeon]
MSEERPESFSNGRYIVVKKLGEGGKGIVFKCTDKMLGRTVALKMIKTSLDEDTVSRFNREAQTTARLGHPNIVSVYDIGSVENHPFLVIEYVDGKSLDDIIKDKSVLSPSEIVQISISIAEALEYAHKLGILHRDIKPENIMISKDNVPKLMDFGLARSVDSPKLTHAGAIVGTPAFISPESALGRENDARSDLYSLGCVMYNMATGQPPFISRDNLKLIYSHINDMPVPIRRIRNDFPQDLESIIMKLLSKDPSKRYQSASELLSTLKSLKYPKEQLFTGYTDTIGNKITGSFSTTSSGHHRRPLVGMENEIRKIRALIDTALSGSGSMVMVSGQTGSGKTRLLEEARGYAAMRGFTVLSVRCAQNKSGIPGQAISEIFREYISSQPTQLIYKICGDYADQMLKIVPEISSRLGKVPEFTGLDPQQQKARFYEAVSVFLENMSKENPLFISFDDVHYMDTYSLNFFSYYYEPVSSQRTVLMGTSKPLDESSDVFKAMEEAIRARSLDIIEIGNLDRENTRRLISNYLGENIDNVSDEFLNLIYSKTYGNPLFLEETLRFLIDKRQIYQKEDGTWDRDSLSELKVPTSLRSIVRSKLEGLSEDYLNLLRTASVIGQDFDYETLMKLSGISDEDKFLNLLEDLIEKKFLSERKGGFGSVRIYFTDPHVREILYEDISMIRRKRMHERVGEIMEESIPAKNIDGLTISSLAEHFQEGGNLPKSLKYRKMEADLFYSMAEMSRAARAYENCLDIMSVIPFTDPEENKRETAQMHLKIAMSLFGIDPANTYKNARSAMDLFREIGDDRQFIEAARIRVQYDPKESQDIYREVEAIKDTNETFEAKFHFLLTYVNFIQVIGDINEAKKISEILKKIAEENKDKLDNFSDKSIIFWAKFVRLTISDINSEADIKVIVQGFKDIIKSISSLSDEKNVRLIMLRSIAYDFLANFYFGLMMDIKQAKESFDAGIEDSEHLGGHSYTTTIKIERIYFCSVFSEGFDEAKQELDSIPRKDIASNTGTSPEQHFNAYKNGVLSWYYLANGDRDELLKCLAYVANVEGMQFRSIHIIPELLYYIDTEADDDFITSLERAEAIYRDKPFTMETILPRAFIFSTSSEVFARLGKLEEARGRYNSLGEMCSSLKQKWLSALHYRAGAVIDMKENRFDEAEDKLSRSVAIWKELGFRFFAGRDLLLLADVYHGGGNLNKSDKSLNSAMELFTQVGAKMYAQKVLARKELLKA